MGACSLCACGAPPGDLTIHQRRALSSQRQPLGIRLGTKPLPSGGPVSGWPSSWHKLRGARGGQLQLVPVKGAHPPTHTVQRLLPTRPHSSMHPVHRQLLGPGPSRRVYNDDGWGSPRFGQNWDLWVTKPSRLGRLGRSCHMVLSHSNLGHTGLGGYRKSGKCLLFCV